MRSSLRGFSLLVVGALLGHPSPGQAQTPTGKPRPADPAVGKWKWIGRN